MHEKTRVCCSSFWSDNRKSKIENLKWLGFLVLFFAWAGMAQAQQPPKIPRVGFVLGSDGSDPRFEAFRQGLRDLGYNEGKNLLIEYRPAGGNLAHSSSRVAELMQLKVDVLASGDLLTIQAAKEATKTIPIVMVSQTDPIAAGLIDSLARPGGNITGIATLSRELSGKRLELVKEVVSRMSRVAILRDADSKGAAIGFKEYEVAAVSLKIPLQSLEVRGPNPDFEGAFHAAAKAHASALIPVRSALLTRHLKRVAELAIKNRTPSMCERSEYVGAGCLMSYATSDAESFRRAAVYVDKILKGAKPADLPVEQPIKFEFIVNLKTAKQIGLTIPPNVLVRADRVIR